MSGLPECAVPGPHPILVSPVPPLGPPPPPDLMSGLAAAAYPNGDLTYDDVAGSLIATDGYLIVVFRDPVYVSGWVPSTSFNAPSPPFPQPPLGPLTGLACDASAGVMWCTDGFAPAPVPLADPTFTLRTSTTPRRRRRRSGCSGIFRVTTNFAAGRRPWRSPA